jgi:hypothetical protein
VIEGLHRILRRAHHEPLPPLLERLAKLGDGGHEEHEQEEIAHDPCHVGEPAPEDEERGEAEPE